jgi:hypothetical protein
MFEFGVEAVAIICKVAVAPLAKFPIVQIPLDRLRLPPLSSQVSGFYNQLK